MIDNYNHTEAQPFFNNIKLTEEQWKKENGKAQEMSRIIENIFLANPTIEISGWLMHRYLTELLNTRVNIISVRRSISNLKKEGKIFKTEKLRMGEEGKPEHLYSTLKNEPVNIVLKEGKSAGDFANSILEQAKRVGFNQPELFKP